MVDTCTMEIRTVFVENEMSNKEKKTIQVHQTTHILDETTRLEVIEPTLSIRKQHPPSSKLDQILVLLADRTGQHHRLLLPVDTDLIKHKHFLLLILE